MITVDIVEENRYLVAEHVELEHPLSKGDVVLLTEGTNEYKTYVVVRSQQTVYRKFKSPCGVVLKTEIIVCGELPK